METLLYAVVLLLSGAGLKLLLNRQWVQNLPSISLMLLLGGLALAGIFGGI